MSKAALIDEVLQLESVTCRAMGASAVPEWRRLELTMAQLKGVIVLCRWGEMPVSGLARELAVGLPAASAVVHRLVEHGLVHRQEDPADRRRTLVRLSPEGEDLLGRLRDGGRGLLRQWLAGIAEEDLSALLSGLRALAHVAESWTTGAQVAHEPCTEG